MSSWTVSAELCCVHEVSLRQLNCRRQLTKPLLFHVSSRLLHSTLTQFVKCHSVQSFGLQLQQLDMSGCIWPKYDFDESIEEG